MSSTNISAVEISSHAYPDDSSAAALMIQFYVGFQYVVTFLAGFVLFSSNLLKNQQVFPFPLKQPDRHVSSIAAVHTMHHLDKIAQRGLQHKVVVIVHKYITVHHNVEPIMIVRQDSKKLPPIIIIYKDIPTLIATARHMVQCARILYSYRPSHNSYTIHDLMSHVKT